MPQWLIDNAWVAWVGVAVALAVLEMLSLELVLVMFALAALAAAVAAGVSGSLIVSLAVFVLVAPALLWFARPPMVARLHRGPDLVTGHDALVGRIAVVLEPVDQYQGRVRLAGETWSARCDRVATFDVGTEVIVTSIDGATAVIAPGPGGFTDS